MGKHHQLQGCGFLASIKKHCQRKKRLGYCKEARPLSESGCDRKMQVKEVNGDRKTCARMAHLGVLPGSELELICRGAGEQCMVKVNGGTISLDALTAANILVSPV